MENLVLEFPEADHIITNKKENRPTDMECQRNEGVQVALHEKHDEYQQTYPDLKSEETSQLEQSKDNMAVECRHKEDSIDIVLQIKGGEDFHMDQELKHVDYQQTTTLKPEDKQDSDKDLGSDSFEMLVGDSDSEHTSTSVSNDEANSEAPLTDDEVEELISEFLEVESKAAEAQESLEQESLARVESDVRAELAENLHGDALDKAVSAEMKIFIEEWESVLDDLETQSALLLEQLDGAGVELPSLYKWVESKAPDACSTEAWKKRVQWVGSQITTEYNQSIRDAEDYLHSCRPVRRKHGRLLENGASGYLARNLSIKDEDNDMKASEEVWKSFGDLIHCGHNVDSTSFGGKKWAAVYLANTPQEAVTLGLQFPGADEVEEIGELEGNAFLAEAIQNETQVGMTEEQKKKYKKVREEDDERITRRLQCHLKKRRKRKKKFQNLIDEEGLDGTTLLTETQRDHQDPNLPENFTFIKKEKQIVRDTSKRPCETDDPEVDHKRSRTVLIGSDEETQMTDIRSMPQSSSENVGSPLCAKKTDIIDVDLLPSPNPTNHNNSKIAEKICCTACSGVLKASEVQNHPILKVIICGSCKFLLVEKMRIEDSFSAVYCCWCGACNDLIHCTSCKTMFCAVCITRNFGKTRLSEIKANGWECCCCSPILLSDFVSECEKLLGYPVVSSSETESAFSDAEANVGIGTRRRRKKAIRRILDDTELGEETKRKIEMEKARQEHLKTMQAQSAGRFCIVDNGSSNETVAECSMDESTNCYIINVAREQDEDPVRIPQSISVKLKPHQVAGIRFMWDNIIQSVKKVKSGDKGLGCILAHTMGLGKTLQVIAFLYTAFRVVDLGLRTALVVTPVNVLHNWRREFAKWQPTELKPLRVLMLEDAPREKRADLLAKWTRKGGVFLIGYAAFRNLSLGRHVKDKNIANAICHALHYGPDVLVCDEAHMIKNTRADITFALKQVKTQRRIALTGSPLQNNLMEYYCMVDFVREGYLGSSHEFRNRFQNPIENGQHANSTMYDVKIMNQRSHILHKQLKGFVQRMDMNVVKKDLPSKTVFVIAVKLSPLQRKLYRKFLDMHGFTGEKISSERVIRRSCFFAGYQTLAQIWNHPGLLQLVKEQRGCLRREDAVENFLMEDVSSDDNMDLDLLSGEKKINDDISNKRSDAAFSHEGGDWWDVLLEEKVYKEADYSGKMVLLLEILAMSSQIGDKALVFSQSLATLDLIELFLSKLPRGIENKYWKQGKDWYRLDGSTQCAERQKMVEKFNEPTNTRVKCTLISTRAGSLGINLHAANRIIIVDGSWNPTYDLQAIYRAWRYGQTKPVYAYRLMAHGTMEEKIYKRQVTKEGLAARVVDRQQIHRTMSKEEMLHLFDFSDDEKADGLEQSQIPSISNQQKATAGSLGEQKSSQLSNGISCSDKLMQSLLRRYHPRWIANYHEHETLLQENESERLTKEEQEIAWQTFQKSLEWEEVHRVVYDDGETQPVSNAHLPEGRVPTQNKLSSTRAVNQRKCTKLDHLLTLRSQTAQYSGSTTCKVCSQEISWKDFSDGRSK